VEFRFIGDNENYRGEIGERKKVNIPGDTITGGAINDSSGYGRGPSKTLPGNNKLCGGLPVLKKGSD